MIFSVGDEVEVASLLEGFRGSYFEATVVEVVTTRPAAIEYIVEYKTLVKDDFFGPLRELVTAVEVPPKPLRERYRDGYRVGDFVDAFDNDGWWSGEITGRVGRETFKVYFECSNEEIAYGVDMLRVHFDWNPILSRWNGPLTRRSVVFELS